MSIMSTRSAVLIGSFIVSPILPEEKKAIRERLLQFIDEPSKKVNWTCFSLERYSFSYACLLCIAYSAKCSDCFSYCSTRLSKRLARFVDKPSSINGSSQYTQYRQRTLDSRPSFGDIKRSFTGIKYTTIISRTSPICRDITHHLSSRCSNLCRIRGSYHQQIAADQQQRESGSFAGGVEYRRHLCQMHANSHGQRY